jgi:short-subunit dehydrogenase
MRKRRSGIVENVSSGAALDGAPSMGVYAAVKASMDG